MCLRSAAVYPPALKALYALTQPRYDSSRALSFSFCDSHEWCCCLGVGRCATQGSYSKAA